MAYEPTSHIREGVSHAPLYRLLKRGSVIAQDATVFTAALQLFYLPCDRKCVFNVCSFCPYRGLYLPLLFTFALYGIIICPRNVCAFVRGCGCVCVCVFGTHMLAA